MSPVAWLSWRERSASQPGSMVARPQLLAISPRSRERLLVGLVLERLASRPRARSDHAVPPSRRARSRVFRRCASHAKDALSQLRSGGSIPAQVTLFFFGLVNAGVSMGALEAGTWGVPIAVIVGKPIGLFVGVGLALLGGFHLPHRVGWRELSVGGLIAAIGFSIGLFFCADLFPPGQSLRDEKGVLVTLVAAPLAIVAAMIFRVGRFSRHT